MTTPIGLKQNSPEQREKQGKTGKLEENSKITKINTMEM